ncbi:MAG: hypothetical protein JWN74_1868 [Acidobacteriaceae bacterium]|nr:hypothetical protein [Acidobacteriaceae bacterium]
MLAYIFLVLAVAVRFMPHPWHFTPVAASLLFFGANRSRRQLWFPVVLLAASDVFLNKFIYSYPLSWDLLVTWVWYAAVVFLGSGLRRHLNPLWIMGSALASSVSFFLLSNFAVWAAYDMYPKNFSGLMTSYAMAVPFFRGTLAGDLVFTAVLFAAPAVIKQFSERSQSRGAAAA